MKIKPRAISTKIPKFAKIKQMVDRFSLSYGESTSRIVRGERYSQIPNLKSEI